MFKSIRAERAWNARYAGKVAGAPDHSYIRVSIEGVSYSAHRIIFAMTFGRWPDAQIDHENHARADNRIGNLREVTNVENARNASMQANNTSGMTGVSWNSRDKKWVAYCRFHGRRINLGTFTDKHKAIAARQAANLKYGFHSNHGAKS